MTDKIKSTLLFGLALMAVGGFGAWHAVNVLAARSALIHRDPSFIRILRTENTSADCGRFISSDNSSAFPDGEIFVIRNGSAVLERDGREALGPKAWPEAGGGCHGGGRNGYHRVFIDPFVLWLFGSAPSS